MLKHILIPIDASPAAESTLDRAFPLLCRPEAEVELLHVEQPPLSAALDPAAAEDARAEAEGFVRDLAKKQSRKGIRCHGEVKKGAVADVILEAADRKLNGLVAMSTHGRAGLKRMALGSVAESVVRRSKVPVLLFPIGSAAKQAPALDLRRIVVPIDGSAASLAIAPFVVELAKAFKSAVTLVHVLPAKPASGESLTHAERVLEDARARFAEDGLECETLLRTGDAVDEIAAVVKQREAGLIACTSHGRTGVARVVLGSVAERLLRTAELPMLIARSVE
jgi:nucleotide-binding universal stress UspA family protein